MSQRQEDEKYINTDPFFGNEAELTCRAVAIRTARNSHACYGLDGKLDHLIEPGQRYRHDRARVDSSFWGEYKICLNCMDKHIAATSLAIAREAAEIGP